MGTDESIFRPLEHQAPAASLPGGGDPLATRRARRETQTVSEIPENTRLLRCLIAGAIVSLALTLAQFIVSLVADNARSVPQSLIFASVTLIKSLGKSDALLAVLLYGALVGVMIGLGLGAVLVRFRRGPFIGMIIGLAVGYGLMNPPWGLIAGALTGIVAGRLATVGLRQVVNV